jgi:hypothetical protein
MLFSLCVCRLLKKEHIVSGSAQFSITTRDPARQSANGRLILSSCYDYHTNHIVRQSMLDSVGSMELCSGKVLGNTGRCRRGKN